MLTRGKYYMDSSGNKFRCNKVEGDKITMLKLGEVSAEFITDIKHAHLYSPIIDPFEIQRLEEQYQGLKRKYKLNNEPSK